MKILLTHVYTAKNKGDAGIVSGMLKRIREEWKGASIELSSMEKQDHNPFLSEGARTISSFFYEAIYTSSSFFVRILRTLIIVFTSTIAAFSYKFFGHQGFNLAYPRSSRTILRSYQEADIIIAVGGCYLRGDNSLRSYTTIILQLHSIMIGIILGKPVYLYSQSIGPFASTFQGWLVARVLNQTELIFAREQITQNLLDEIGVNKRLVKKGIDAGFLLENNDKQFGSKYLNRKGIIGKNIIGVSVRNWLQADKQIRYEHEIAKTVDSITKDKESFVVFIPQVTARDQNDDDRLVAERVYKSIKNKKQAILINEELTHFQIKSIYSTLSCLIGTRMHANIFTLSTQVPVIAISYEHKTDGIMKGLGLSQWVVPIAEVESKELITLYKKLNMHKTKYLKHLNLVIPEMIKQAEIPMTIIKKHWEGSSAK